MTLVTNTISSGASAGMPCNLWEPLWYAAYTSANREKRVAEQLVERSVEHFLPLYQSVRRWKDRRVKLQLPLFHGYVFVRLALSDRLLVLQVPGVSKLVGFNGRPTPLPQEEIAALKEGLKCGVHAQPYPYLTKGRHVKIRSGPLEGRHGILLRRKGSVRVVLSVDLILRSIAVDVDIADVEPLGQGGASMGGTPWR